MHKIYQNFWRYTMKLGTQEHENIMKEFEKLYKYYRLDKEKRGLWGSGLIYQDGEVNKLYQAFILGYATGRIVYLK